MKTNRNPLSLAILSATTSQHVGIAALSFAVDEDTGWVQLLPAGHFNAVDGRPHEVPGGKWFIDAEIAQRLITTAQSATNDLVIDYEHQTLKKDENGKPAPAAGWIKDMEWREGSGLWIKPDWTSRALDFIKNNEYRYISAVFPYSKEGIPSYIHSAALTNRAGIDGMQELEALSANILSDQQLEKPAMNETMRKLLAKLGITLQEGETLNEEQETAALSALDELVTKAGKADDLETQVATLSAQDNLYDPSKHVPLEAFQELETQVAALTAKSGESALETAIANAKKDGRLLASMEDWARDLGKKDMAALTAYLDKAQPLAALSEQQTDGKDQPETEHKTDLTEEDLAVLSATGMDEEEFRKTKKELN